jgi:hypothetical protein
VIGHREQRRPRRAALFVLLAIYLYLPCILSFVTPPWGHREFCTCHKEAQSVCLELPIERLMPSRGPAHEVPEGPDPDPDGELATLRIVSTVYSRDSALQVRNADTLGSLYERPL